jgi:hypothetical protein
MTGQPLAKRLLIAVTLMVAALLLAPSGALAHVGHSHSSASGLERVQPVTPLQQVVDGKTASGAVRAVPITDFRAATVGHDTLWLTAAAPTTPDKICPGGCCSAGTSCCCAASLPAAAQIITTPYGKSLFEVAVFRGAGIEPGTLPEPPKSLV